MSNTVKTSPQHLIIYTRYPEPGKTKTRLIPFLGEKEAADLQQKMTEYTLMQAQKLLQLFPVTIEVRFAGGNLQLMKKWLSKNFNSQLLYQHQGEGDLGQKMANSFLEAFNQGAEQVITIGSDCPGVNTEILATAFQHLKTHDLVVGPAIDGGYYLIGLQRNTDELFHNINWGTEQVLQQTIDIAQKLNLSVEYLPILADVDRPEDLYVWEQILNK
ncbi:MAG: TIGR04282 family arsenosugar biosynthesis glycosyltransferase [Scytonematopsis contorta HA4267-MV1]|jgi:hypothetical protein|nr:TIGR04282 family arsenosugar biosynthesis glycosyltransferase [Scytonematopsis contorta HA4267-MV1]